jgi:hypothetical protein
MEKRLVPYSVHLREDIYNKLKEAAGSRKASALVRDAITMIIEGDDSFNGGYNKAVRDMIAHVQQDQWCQSLAVDGVTIESHLVQQLEQMIVSQKVNP